ncbi:GH92 family glycosyl hydrolase [Pedobacter antarcticus]|uniref:GH92 family glycosyl hydrolase n=1 Tax=Pedobacter antarcticus TaxID=34086 RepID=UPI0008861CF9|nr:GH92 family glycosyl hydrolase [Pedobacter antarcticus]SDM18310.1 alpha-1,2-mannosidase, putative [Pedobacter antarcticus]
MVTKKAILLLAIGLSSAGLSAQQKNLVQYVNTLQGTNSTHELTRGNTYPTTALPFGMNTWTPQTGKNGDGWKYQYHKKTIRGFQQAHQCSSWSRDYAVFSLMPVLDSLVVDEDKRATAFSHDQETGKPDYYQVKFANQLQTEIAPTERGAHLRFSYPKGKKSFLVLDGYTNLSGVQIDVAKRTITGYVNNGEGFKEGFRNFFVMRFDQPFKAYGTWENKQNTIQTGNLSAEGKGKGAYLEFKPGLKVQVKVASSYISPEQAVLNLETELGNDKQLEDTRRKAAAVWNASLGKIEVEGGTKEDKETFYSCFFRASLFSRKFYELDKDGKPYYFSPYDGKVHEGYMYTDTGFWDTFRAQFPLNTIMHPEMHGRYMQGLISAWEQCGWLPSWSFPSEAGSMIGNHAISLLTDAWAKGIRTFDPQQALKAYLHEATNKGPWGPANGRDGWKDYYQLGYVPYPEVREATAKTLEYSYDDFCGFQLAEMTGQTFYSDIFKKTVYNYKNVMDPQTKFMRGRDRQGKWNASFDPYEWGGPFTEGNAWHWQWSVFHDVQGLIDLMGGDEAFNTRMDSVFTAPNTVNVGSYGGMIHEMTEMVMADMGQYAHGNQPIQHMPYLYTYSGQPWKTQYQVRNIMSKLYNATENGYPGDEDQGQTSSWYVLSALGFYSVTPGTDQYVLGSPAFKKITINLENGKQFVIQADGNDAEHVYIKSATLNGKPYAANYVKHSDITNGGLLRLEMSASPEKQRGTKLADRPFSLSTKP